MTKRLSLDKAGRVVIPKPMREALGLRPGDALIVEGSGESITLKPARDESAVRRERGHWVYHGALPKHFSITDAIRTDREERIRRLSR